MASSTTRTRIPPTSARTVERRSPLRGAERNGAPAPPARRPARSGPDLHKDELLPRALHRQFLPRSDPTDVPLVVEHAGLKGGPLLGAQRVGEGAVGNG